MKGLFTAAFVAAAAGIASGQLVITEIRTKAASDYEDYFELTNLGSTAIDISGWQFDDESADLGDAVALEGITSIAAGETVVFIQGAFTFDVDDFRAEWGGLAGVQVGYYDGSGLGKGDAITLFDAADNVALSLAYGMTSPEETHAGDWAAGNTDGSDTFEQQAAVWIPGTNPQEWAVADGINYGTFADSNGNFGSPGVIPAPAGAALMGLGLLAGARRRR